MAIHSLRHIASPFILICIPAVACTAATQQSPTQNGGEFDGLISKNVNAMLEEGRQTFRYDTFGDEGFWSEALKLHQAIEGSAQGGVGTGLSPTAALAVGLKVDAAALPDDAAQGALRPSERWLLPRRALHDIQRCGQALQQTLLTWG